MAQGTVLERQRLSNKGKECQQLDLWSWDHVHVCWWNCLPNTCCSCWISQLDLGSWGQTPLLGSQLSEEHYTPCWPWSPRTVADEASVKCYRAFEFSDDSFPKSVISTGTHNSKKTWNSLLLSHYTWVSLCPFQEVCNGGAPSPAAASLIGIPLQLQISFSRAKNSLLSHTTLSHLHSILIQKKFYTCFFSWNMFSL